MKLSDMPARKNVGRTSSVDMLPEQVRAQLIEARRNATHSTSVMVDWLQSEGYEITVGALTNWFQTRKVPYGAEA